VYCAITALVDPGDEVVLIEPFFDIYLGAVELSHAVSRYIPLRPKSPDISSSSELCLDLQELENLITPKTRVLVINNPHNPTGKVFSLQELQGIADIVRCHENLVVIVDEVYEFLVYDENKHERFCKLEGMWERTLTVGSAGKTFSVTGWKVGWLIGPAELISTVCYVHAFTTFTISTPAQEALAVAIETAESEKYFEWLKQFYQNKRDILVKCLSQVGLKPIVPQGTFFVLVQVDPKLKERVPADIGERESLTGQNNHDDDWNMARYFTIHVGVAVIPVATLFSAGSRELSKGVHRLSFCKTDEVLQTACLRLRSALLPG